jgi:ketosteroid isomerase-like protein
MMPTPVADCSAARHAALVDGDLEQLSALLSDDLRYVHATGVCHGKAEYLAFVRERMKFIDVRLELQTIKEYGEVAVVTGQLRQRVFRSGESEPVTLLSWAIEVWKKADGWRLPDFQSTRLPPESLNQSSSELSGLT